MLVIVHGTYYYIYHVKMGQSNESVVFELRFWLWKQLCKLEEQDVILTEGLMADPNPDEITF